MTRAALLRPRRLAWAMYRGLGASLAEFLWMAGRGVDDLEPWVRIDPASREALDLALGLGRGIVLAASHTGNWDLAACVIARRVPLTVVTKRLSASGLDAFWQGTRRRQGVRLVEARGALAMARRALGDGEAVAMMIDQVPDDRDHAVTHSFLGAPAWVDVAPATVAARTGAPLVVTAARRDASGVHHLHVLAVLEPPHRPGTSMTATAPALALPSRRAWIRQATGEATAALEAFVLAHPDQWLWLHRRWRAPRLSRRSGLGMPMVPCTTPSSSPGAPSGAASS